MRTRGKLFEPSDLELLTPIPEPAIYSRAPTVSLPDKERQSCRQCNRKPCTRPKQGNEVCIDKSCAGALAPREGVRKGVDRDRGCNTIARLGLLSGGEQGRGSSSVHLMELCDLIRLMNSARVLSLRLNAPSIDEVMVVAPGFCTPRMVMHWWLAGEKGRSA